MFHLYRNPPSRRVLGIRLSFLLGLGVSLMLLVDMCTPVRLYRHPSAQQEEFLASEHQVREYVFCKQQADRRLIYRVKAQQTVIAYTSGRKEVEQRADTLYVGSISADLNCPRHLNLMSLSD